MAVPTWAVGQVLAAADINTWFVPTVVIKPSDTSRTNNTLSADPALVIAGAANATYSVDGLIVYNGASNAGFFQFQFTVPASASCAIAATYEYTGGGVDAGGTTAYLPAGVTIGRIAWTGGTGSTYPVALSGSFTTAGTAGNLTFRWSQNITNATATTVQAGSFLTLTRIN